MRVGARALLLPVLLAGACGGVSSHKASDDTPLDASPGDAPSDVGGDTCTDAESAIPDAGVFVPPTERDPDFTYRITFRNACTQTVWPAWSTSGGLENGIVDTDVWLPIPPDEERTITVYGGVGEIGFWGRTGCAFDRDGNGTCETGDCRGFVCGSGSGAASGPVQSPPAGFPSTATVFILMTGFLESYNLGLRVEGPYCGNYECVTDVSTCPSASTVVGKCGQTIACSNLCGDGATHCCGNPGKGCKSRPSDQEPFLFGDIVMTFCP